MSRSIRLALPSLLLAGACTGDSPAAPRPDEGAPVYYAAPAVGVRDEFLVVLGDGVDPRDVARAIGVQPRRTYRGVVNGFSVHLSPSQLARLRVVEGVEYVEQDQVMRKSGTQSIAATGAWGLDRIDQPSLPLSASYSYVNTGAGVRAYIVDTGIAPHNEFATPGGSRVVNFFDAVDGTFTDCDGHGTHVAGTVGGTTYGVAKGVTLLNVRVLDCIGVGSTGKIVAALDQIRLNGVRPAVVNLSVGGWYSKTLNRAIDRLVGAGFATVVAAGNEGGYSCDYSPASAVQAISVAATDSTDSRAPFSNWGRCVTLYAPGVDVLSATIGSSTASAYLSGTSMAAPHVTGVVALYLQSNPAASASSIRGWLSSGTARGKVKLNDTGTVMYGTPNFLLQKGAL